MNHQQLLAAAQQRLKAQVEYTALPAHLIPEEFTLSELQKELEAILEVSTIDFETVPAEYH